jgi:hypothetical protein
MRIFMTLPGARRRRYSYGNQRFLWVAMLLGIALIYGGWQAQAAAPELPGNPEHKITFDLSVLNRAGLYGPPSGLRALHYEFCIPANPDYEARVKAIDPTIVINHKSRGRIGCSAHEYLCLGSTHQPEFRRVLSQLARLPYVKRIDQAFFE